MYTYEGKFQPNNTAEIWVGRVLYNLILCFVSGAELWRLSTHPSRPRARSHFFEGISSRSKVKGNFFAHPWIEKLFCWFWCYALWKDKYARNSLRYVRQIRIMTWWRMRSKFPTVRWLSSWFKCSGWKMTVCMHRKAPDEHLQWH